MKALQAIVLTCCLVVLAGCEKFVEVGLPDTRISSTAVFGNDYTALAAASGMYYALLQGHGILGGSVFNVTVMAGMSADEVADVSNFDVYATFYTNMLSADNNYVQLFWNAAYNAIYEANAVREGVTQSAALSDDIKSMLEGEALFVRALCHFYLVNLFGDVPVITTTDYRVNTTATRVAADAVYDQIIEDLEAARTLLPANGAPGERLRPSADAAAALLARVRLYREEYSVAEAEATSIINQGLYELEDVNDVFLAESGEAVWQLSQVVPGSFPTGDALLFIINNDFFLNALSGELLEDFETGDARNDAWTEPWTTEAGDIYYYAHKYKEQYAIDSYDFTETLSVLRLGEQYLIRAEARARQGNLAGAIEDIDMIRERAGLPLIAAEQPGIGQEALIDLILHEKRIELFCEQGHRWLDLKRTGKADEVLGAVKPGWNSSAVLYPLPEAELSSNPYLRPQNEGY